MMLTPIKSCGDHSGEDTSIPPCRAGLIGRLTIFGVAERGGLQLSVGVRDNVVGKVFSSAVSRWLLGI